MQELNAALVMARDRPKGNIEQVVDTPAPSDGALKARVDVLELELQASHSNLALEKERVSLTSHGLLSSARPSEFRVLDSSAKCCIDN